MFCSAVRVCVAAEGAHTQTGVSRPPRGQIHSSSFWHSQTNYLSAAGFVELTLKNGLHLGNLGRVRRQCFRSEFAWCQRLGSKCFSKLEVFGSTSLRIVATYAKSKVSFGSRAPLIVLPMLSSLRTKVRTTACTGVVNNRSSSSKSRQRLRYATIFETTSDENLTRSATNRRSNHRPSQLRQHYNNNNNFTL